MSHLFKEQRQDNRILIIQRMGMKMDQDGLCNWHVTMNAYAPLYKGDIYLVSLHNFLTQQWSVLKFFDWLSTL